MTVFHAAEGGLRPPWKLARVLALCFAITLFLAVLASLVHLRWMSEYAFHAGAILAVLISLRLEGRSLASVGLSIREGWGGDLLLGIAWGTLSIAAVAAGMVWITKETSTAAFFSGFGAAALAKALIFYAVLAVGEEILFRGYIISALRETLGEASSIAIAAVMFTAIHVINPDYYWFAFAYALLMGILLGFVFVRRGTLWMVIGLHFAWDFLQSDVVFNPPPRGGEIVFTVVIALNFVVARYLAGRSTA